MAHVMHSMRSKALVAPGCATKAGTRKFVYPAILLCMMVSCPRSVPHCNGSRGASNVSERLRRRGPNSARACGLS